ncbi:hypothetical protein [Leucobacter sp. VD1]|uniref:hypothetical protein n=1 Tax=Leucobacter sp. VD1 TaxID=3080381 RepID=UPI003018AB73
MSQSSETAAPTWAAPAALVAGIASVLLLILNFVALSGMAVLVVSMIAGVLAVVFGIVAVKARVSKGAAIAGMVTGGIGFLFSAAIIVFALLFIGALGV